MRSVATSTTLAIVVAAPCTVGCMPVPPPLALETRYAERGPWDVVSEVIEAADGTPYQLYRPDAVVAAGDVGWPIVAWGNGTIANPDNYIALHEHLASRGFVVVDSFSETTGTGREIAASVQLLLDDNARVDSAVFRQLDVEHIAAVGHSQGATGVINAQTDFSVGPAISTVVSVALPALHWCDEKDTYDTSRLSSSFLILGGADDQIVSPAFSNQAALRALSPSLRGAMGLVRGAGHSAVEDDGTVLRGYLTAWLSMQLLNDDVAAAVFVGDDAEIVGNPRWQDVERRRPLL